MGLRIVLAAAVLVLSGCGADPVMRRDPFSRTGELIAWSGGGAGAANACHVCHGLDGGGNGAAAPRIAGLPRGYIVKQLGDYADGRRQNEYMGSIAKRLSEEERQLVSAWFAEAPIPDVIANAPTADDEAERLWREGDAGRGLSACASCHGPNGEGVGNGGPPLHDQPPAYLAEQLRLWQRGVRRNDPASVMIRAARALSPAEVTALAQYAAALPGASDSKDRGTEPLRP